MKYKIELKTNMYNDGNCRMPGLEAIKKSIDEYISIGKGLIVTYDSIYDYQYDTALRKYNKVDSLGVQGHIINSIIEDDKIYLNVEMNDDIVIDYKCICYFRTNLRSSVKNNNSNSNLFDVIQVFSVDIINVSNDKVDDDKISTVEEIY